MRSAAPSTTPDASEGAAPGVLARLLRERDQLEALADMARAIGGSLRLSDVMHLALRHAVALLNTQGAGLGLLRDEQVVVVAGLGAGEKIIGAALPTDASVCGQAIAERRCIIVNDATIPAAYEPTRTAANINRVIIAPLYSSQGPLGVLSVLNRDAEFTDDDATVLQRLADQVAVAVANARLYEEANAAAEGYRQAVEDERRARDAVAQSEARYRNLFEAATDAIYTVDRQGSFTSVNEATCQLAGRSREELLGRSPLPFVGPSDAARVSESFKVALAGIARQFECRFVRPDDTIRFATVTNSPIRHGSEVIGVLGVARDVTDERRLTDQLIQQEKLAAVGQLVSGVAHELNNPLASVMAFAQLLLTAPEDAQYDQQAIEAINQEAKRAAKIVSNLLTFARQHQPERTFTDLNRVIDDTLELRRYALRVAEVDIRTDLDPQLPVTWADPFQLQQVVLNLVTNAEQALSGWDGTRAITVSTHWDRDVLQIRVCDSGPGVPAEHLSRIFNPFFTTKPVGEGTGLGLSISDGIVREHGGRIRAESRPGLGASFVIDLPYVPPPSPVPPAGREGTTPVASPKRLLMVDDEAGIRLAVTTFFRSLGHTVDAVGSGREGIARAMAARYDALLLDLRLPDTTGDQVVRELERLSRLPGRVVFITGDTQSQPALDILEELGRPVLSKPFVLDELALVVLAEADAGPLF